MSVYKKFDKNDILFSTVHTRPRISAKYGASGWVGNTGASASISLYGGVRSRYDVKASDFQTSGISVYPLDPLDTHSIDKVTYISGSYPATGSIRFVRCTNQPATSLGQITSTRWYEEHYRPIERLFDYYGTIDSNYFTGSYDFYSALLLANTNITTDNAYPGSYFIFSGAFQGNGLSSTSSFSLEAWIKPLSQGTDTANPFPNYPCIMMQQGIWALYLNTNGGLRFSHEFMGGFYGESTTRITPNRWNHVCVSVSGGVSASFIINGQQSNSALITTSLPTGSSGRPLVVGAYENDPLIAGATGSSNGLNGFIFETRVWKKVLVADDVSDLLSGTLIDSSSADLVHYARYNDGPFGVAHGFASGSGAFDYSRNAHHGYVSQYPSPYYKLSWQSNDHETFVPLMRKTNLDISDIRLVHVPSMFYGRQIDPGSVVVTDGTYNARKIVRVLNDDGRGTLYLSGSVTRLASGSGEDYTGATRRKVGNVFYTEGLIVLTDPSFYDMFDTSAPHWISTMNVSGVFPNLLSIDFEGQHRVHTKTFNCRLGTAQVNASNNPTFSYLDDQGTEATDDDRTMVLRNDGITYITAIGIYDDERNLVAVAKIAQPIRKREKDKLNIRLKMDF